MSPLIVGGRTIFGALSSQPTGITTTAGSEYYDTTQNKEYLYNGTGWFAKTTEAPFNGDEATHWWKSEGITSATTWTAERGGYNFTAGGSGTLTVNTSDGSFNNQQTIGQSGVDQYRYMLADSGSNGTFWNASQAWSDIVVFEKTTHIGGTWGDSLFNQQWNGQPDGSWSIDIEGDHTWGGSYGEVVGNTTPPGSYPQRGIMCARMGASGASGELSYWSDGATSWYQLATWSSLPSGISNSYDALGLFNFEGATHTGHRFNGKYAEVAYFKDLRITDSTRNDWKNYLVEKFAF